MREALANWFDYEMRRLESAGRLWKRWMWPPGWGARLAKNTMLTGLAFAVLWLLNPQLLGDEIGWRVALAGALPVYFGLVLSAALMAAPAEMEQKLESDWRARREQWWRDEGSLSTRLEELKGEEANPDPLVDVRGLQELGPVFDMVSRIGTERMQVLVCDWRGREEYEQDLPCSLNWPNGSVGIELAVGEPVRLLLSRGWDAPSKMLTLNAERCGKRIPALTAQEFNGTIQTWHDVCLQFIAKGAASSQKVWVRVRMNWSQADGSDTAHTFMIANSTEVLDGDPRQ